MDPTLPASGVPLAAIHISPRAIFRLGLGAAALVVLLNISLLVGLRGEEQLVQANDSLALLASALAAAGLAYAARRSARHSRRTGQAWLLLALAALSLTAGDLSFFVQEVILRQNPWPSISDLFYLLVYPLFLAGTVLLPVERVSIRALGMLMLDAVVIMLSSGLILWELMLQPILAAGAMNPMALAVSIAYPIGDLILLWAIIMLIFRPYAGQPRQTTRLLLLSGALILCYDLLATGALAAGTYSSGSWLNLIFTAATMVLMLSGLLQAVSAAPPSPDSSLPPHPADWLLQIVKLGLPYLWLGGAYLILTLETPATPGSHWFLSLWVAVILGLVILRQILVIMENRRLTQALQGLNTDLERRVRERTAALTQANDDLRQEMTKREKIEHILREREENLAHNALHDALTGLPNRSLLAERIDRAIRQQQRGTYHFAVLFLDFDGFKIINDSLGHLAGDRLLVEIARRLQGCVRAGDTVARLGGDEFVILMEGLSSTEGMDRAAERLQEKLAEPFDIAANRVFLSASVGVVPGNPGYQEPADILRDADLAMYQAKNKGKGRYEIFDPRLRTEAIRRLMLENDLRAALERGELRLNYQPILALDTGQFTGFEALLRWPHPERGLIPPVDFIPIAESSGLIWPITQWVLLEACRQARTWQEEYPSDPPLTISVNLSPRLFTQPDITQMVTRALEETGLTPQGLKLEITEGVIVEEAADTRAILNRWREMGIQIQMDDFGTGYSSLSYLHQFPIDTLKIDRAFIRRIRGDGDNGEIVRTITALARELNLGVIAEGVETLEQLNFIKRLGCQGGQGFYISHPLEPDAAAVLLAGQRRHANPMSS